MLLSTNRYDTSLLFYYHKTNETIMRQGGWYYIAKNALRYDRLQGYKLSFLPKL